MKNCEVGNWHDFAVVGSPFTVGSKDTKQVEVCKLCHERKEYGFETDGRMMNEHQYFLDHIRFFAQPFGDTKEVYYAMYPEMKVKHELEEKEKKLKETFNLEYSDKFKFAIKRALQDRPDGIIEK